MLPNLLGNLSYLFQSSLIISTKGGPSRFWCIPLTISATLGSAALCPYHVAMEGFLYHNLISESKRL